MPECALGTMLRIAAPLIPVLARAIAARSMRMAGRLMQPMYQDPDRPAECSVRPWVHRSNDQPWAQVTTAPDSTTRSVVIGDPRLITPEDRRMAQWARGQFRVRARAEVSATAVWAQPQTTRDP